MADVLMEDTLPDTETHSQGLPNDASGVMVDVAPTAVHLTMVK